MKYTILIVEDDNDSREALALLLRLEGYNVVTAADGTAGLNCAEAHTPDLIITDICMPGLSGTALTSRIRARDQFRHVPIIATTAAPEQSRQEVMNAGAVACMSKPIDLLLLLNMINDLLTSSWSATSVA